MSISTYNISLVVIVPAAIGLMTALAVRGCASSPGAIEADAAMVGDAGVVEAAPVASPPPGIYLRTGSSWARSYMAWAKDVRLSRERDRKVRSVLYDAQSRYRMAWEGYADVVIEKTFDEEAKKKARDASKQHIRSVEAKTLRSLESILTSREMHLLLSYVSIEELALSSPLRR